MDTCFDFNKAKEIKYYIPCYIPILNQMMIEKGTDSRMEFLLIARLGAIPNIEVSEDGKISILPSIGEILGYKSEFEYLNIKGSRLRFKSFEEGYKYLKKQNQNGEMSAVCGTPYYLPYSKDYYSSNYVEKFGDDIGYHDHFIGVYGIGKDILDVWDTTPINRIEKIDIGNFRLFWRGHGGVPGLEEIANKFGLESYCAYTIELLNLLKFDDVNRLMESGIKTICQEYINGTEIRYNQNTIYSGYKSLEKIVLLLETSVLTF